MESKRVIVSFLWRFAERCGAQLVSFVVSLVLARILEPETYGTIALIIVITSVLNVFVDSGLGNALIQKKDANDVDFSTVFYFNIIMCLSLYFILFFVSPLIANFYDNSELTPVIRVLALTVVLSGVKNVQLAYVSRTMQFKKFFFSTLGGTIGAAVVGISLAYSGFGIWSLVAQQVFNVTVDTIILWITVKWRPKKVFSFGRLKNLYSFGWKLLVSSLLETIYNNIRQLIIGKMYSTADLSFYNRGKQFPEFIVNNVNSSIDSVLLPTMSKEQDDYTRVKAMTRRSIMTSIYIMAPMMFGLACCSETLIILLLTEKWIGCVPYLRIFCVTFTFYPVHTANLNALKAIGRSDLYLKLEILKKIVGVILLVSTMWFGPLVMAYSMLFSSVICQMINVWPNKKLLNYGYLQQLKDFLPSILLAAAMGGIVYPIQFIGLSGIVTLIIQVLVGAFVYVIGSKLFHMESFEYLLGIVKPIINKFKG